MYLARLCVQGCLLARGQLIWCAQADLHFEKKIKNKKKQAGSEKKLNPPPRFSLAGEEKSSWGQAYVGTWSRPTAFRCQERWWAEGSILCCKCIACTGRSYPSACLQIYTPSRTLRSASHTPVPFFFFFFFCDLSTWNDLPIPLRKNPLLTPSNPSSNLFSLKTVHLPCYALSHCFFSSSVSLCSSVRLVL